MTTQFLRQLMSKTSQFEMVCKDDCSYSTQLK